LVVLLIAIHRAGAKGRVRGGELGLAILKINQLYPTVGMDKGRAILRWDPVAKCSKDCVIWEDCPYDVKNKPAGQKCRLEIVYMNKIFHTLISPDGDGGIGDMLDDIEYQRLGVHLIPLYHQLIRMKKEAYAVKRMTYATKQGGLAIHPIFKEIREIMWAIDKEIRALGLNEKWRKKYGKGSEGMKNVVDMEALFERGDPDFYETLTK